MKYTKSSNYLDTKVAKNTNLKNDENNLAIGNDFQRVIKINEWILAIHNN